MSAALAGAGNYAIKSGQRKLSDNQTGRKRLQFPDGNKVIKINKNIAPLVMLIKKLGNNKTVGQPGYNHLEGDRLPLTVEIAGNETDSDTAIALTSGNGSYVRVGQLLKNQRTSESIRVTAITTDDLTVTRGIGGTTAAAMTALDELLIMGLADTEGNTHTSSISSEPAIKTNYCQIFKAAIEASGRDIESDNYGEDEWDRMKSDCVEQIQQQKEMQYLFFNGISSSDATITAGIEYWVTTNVTNQSGLLTEAALEDWIVRWMRRNYGADNDLVTIAGENFIKALDGFARDSIRYGPDDTKLGMKVAKWRCGFGEISVMPHGLLTPMGSGIAASDLGGRGYAFGLNLKNLGERTFKNRGLRYEKDIQTPGTDGMKAGYMEDVGLWLANEKSHSIFKGITG